jgi:hypothetical protein
MFKNLIAIVLVTLVLSVPAKAATVYHPYCCFTDWEGCFFDLPPGVPCYDSFRNYACGDINYVCKQCYAGYGYGYFDDNGDNDDKGKGWEFSVDSTCDNITVTVELDGSDEADVTIFGVGSGSTTDQVFTVEGNFCYKTDEDLVDIYVSPGSPYQPGSDWEHDYKPISCDECEEEEESHLACVEEACVEVSGAGEDECDVSADCKEEEPEPEPAPAPDRDCYTDEDCTATHYCTDAGDCMPVTGCGNVVSHELVPYQCNDDNPDCPDCPEGYECIDNYCEESTVEGEDDFVGENTTITVKIGDEPCANCDVQVTGPDGKTITGKTDGNGNFNLPLLLEGNYSKKRSRQRQETMTFHCSS